MGAMGDYMAKSLSRVSGGDPQYRTYNFDAAESFPRKRG